MYTEQTRSILETLRENEKELIKQNKEVKKLITGWNKTFKRIMNKF
jgi:hypothetical protein